MHCTRSCPHCSSLLARLGERALFRTRALSTLTAEHCSGKRKHSNRLWALFVLEKWFARYAPEFAL